MNLFIFFPFLYNLFSTVLPEFALLDYKIISINKNKINEKLNDYKIKEIDNINQIENTYNNYNLKELDYCYISESNTPLDVILQYTGLGIIYIYLIFIFNFFK